MGASRRSDPGCARAGRVLLQATRSRAPKMTKRPGGRWVVRVDRRRFVTPKARVRSCTRKPPSISWRCAGALSARTQEHRSGSLECNRRSHVSDAGSTALDREAYLAARPRRLWDRRRCHLHASRDPPSSASSVAGACESVGSSSLSEVSSSSSGFRRPSRHGTPRSSARQSSCAGGCGLTRPLRAPADWVQSRVQPAPSATATWSSRASFAWWRTPRRVKARSARSSVKLFVVAVLGGFAHRVPDVFGGEFSERVCDAVESSSGEAIGLSGVLGCERTFTVAGVDDVDTALVE